MMNLKVVAVSMGVLGLLSSPVFAEPAHKTVKHAKKHYSERQYSAMPTAATSLADLGSPLDRASLTSVLLDDMQQNSHMYKPRAEWFHDIKVSGGINMGMIAGSRSVVNSAYAERSSGIANNYAGETTGRFPLYAYANVTGSINDWTNAVMVVSNTKSEAVGKSSSLNEYSSLVGFEQAFMHFGNFEHTPFFFEAGKQYIDYGRYNVRPIVASSLDQVLTQANAPTVKLGFIHDKGVSASLYGFQNAAYRYNDANAEGALNYGASLGYAGNIDQMSYKLGAGYMYDMMGVDSISKTVSNFEGYTGYHGRVGGMAAYASMNYDAFSLGANYTSAIKHFNAADLARSASHPTAGARPWAAGIKAGYDFSAWNKSNNIYLGYQASGDTVYLNLPHTRYLVGYTVDVMKNAQLSAELNHNNAWSSKVGGPASGDSNLVAVRAAVRFG